MLERKDILGTVLVEVDHSKGRSICHNKALANSLGMAPIFALLKNHLQNILRFGEKQTSNNIPETRDGKILAPNLELFSCRHSIPHIK